MRVFFNYFIKSAKLKVIARDVAASVFSQTDNEFYSHLFTFIFTFPTPWASYQWISAR